MYDNHANRTKRHQEKETSHRTQEKSSGCEYQRMNEQKNKNNTGTSRNAVVKTITTTKMIIVILGNSKNYNDNGSINNCCNREHSRGGRSGGSGTNSAKF